MDEKQQAREMHAISQQHGMAGAAFKDFFDKTPFTLNDMAKVTRATCDKCGWFGFITDLSKGNCPKCGSNAIYTTS